MIFEVFANGRMVLPGGEVIAALGKSGVKPAPDKREGDGATPIGVWPIRQVMYRADRGPAPATALRVRPISPSDGWCDAPGDPAYNRLITLPYPASAERLWRDDGIYDFVVVIGHNDDPVVSGRGSAIFLHLQRPEISPTEGCVALTREAMARFLATAKPGDKVRING